MLAVLANRTYRHLFAAQVIALLGTGLLTVALGLLAFELAGENAGAVLGTALAIKMIAYVGVAPVASAFAERVPRRAMLVALDLVRAGIALFLPFVTEIWQIYILIFVLQAASAGFTPTFQTTIPDVLPDEARYVWARFHSCALQHLRRSDDSAAASLCSPPISRRSVSTSSMCALCSAAQNVRSEALGILHWPSRHGKIPAGFFSSSSMTLALSG